ncbi:hypothetical protein STEG23_008708, partial [Scotinomys teguina]
CRINPTKMILWYSIVKNIFKHQGWWGCVPWPYLLPEYLSGDHHQPQLLHMGRIQ